MRKLGIALNVLGRIESIIPRVMLSNGEISGTRKSQVKMRYTTKYVYHVVKAIPKNLTYEHNCYYLYLEQRKSRRLRSYLS